MLSVDNFWPLKSVNCRSGRDDLPFHFFIVSKDVEVLFLTRSQLSMYMLLVSVAVNHVLYEVLDHVTHITVLHN